MENIDMTQEPPIVFYWMSGTPPGSSSLLIAVCEWSLKPVKNWVGPVQLHGACWVYNAMKLLVMCTSSVYVPTKLVELTL